MRKYIVFTLAAAIVIAVTGCGSDAKTSSSGAAPEIISQQSSLSASSGVAVQEIPSPKAELYDGDKVTVYTIGEYKELYDRASYQWDESTTLGDVVNMVAKELNREIQVIEITIDKSMVTVNLDPDFFEHNSKSEVYSILNSVATTMLNNFAGSVVYQVGGKYDMGLTDEPYTPAPLKLVEGTQEEFAAIRAQVPFQDVDYETYAEYHPVRYAVEKQDETARYISWLLSQIGLINHNVESPQELMEKYGDNLREWLVWHTYSYTNNELTKPIELAVEDDTVIIQEHVEIRAKQIFGEDFVFIHGPAGIFDYHKTAGVYTPPHMGGGYRLMPVVLDYQDNGDTVTAQIVYIVDSMSGFTYRTADGWGEGEPVAWDWPDGTAAQQEALTDLIINRADRAEVVVNKTSDGRFAFQSYSWLD